MRKLFCLPVFLTSVLVLSTIPSVVSKKPPSDSTDDKEVNRRFLVFESHAVPNTLRNPTRPDNSPGFLEGFDGSRADTVVKKREAQGSDGESIWYPVPENTAQNRHLANAYSPSNKVKRDYCIPAYASITCNPGIPHGGCCDGADCAYDGSQLRCYKYVSTVSPAGHEGKHFLIPSSTDLRALLPRSSEECQKEECKCRSSSHCEKGLDCVLATAGDEPRCKRVQIQQRRSEKQVVPRTCGEFREGCSGSVNSCCSGLTCDAEERTCRFRNAHDKGRGQAGLSKEMSEDVPSTKKATEKPVVSSENSRNLKESLTQEDLAAFHDKIKKLLEAYDTVTGKPAFKTSSPCASKPERVCYSHINPNSAAVGSPTIVFTGVMHPNGRITFTSLTEVGYKVNGNLPEFMTSDQVLAQEAWDTHGHVPVEAEDTNGHVAETSHGHETVSEDEASDQSASESASEYSDSDSEIVETSTPMKTDETDTETNNEEPPMETDEGYISELEGIDDLDLDSDLEEFVEEWYRKQPWYKEYLRKLESSRGSAVGKGNDDSAASDVDETSGSKSDSDSDTDYSSDSDSSSDCDQSDSEHCHAKLVARNRDRDELRKELKKRYDLIRKCHQAGDKCRRDEQCCHNLDCQKEKESDKYGRCKNMTWRKKE